MDGARAGLFHIFPGQISIQALTRPGQTTAQLQVILNCDLPNEIRSNLFEIAVASASPQFFFFVNNLDGVNPIAAVNHTTGAFVGSPGIRPDITTRPARPGDTVILFLTGLGETAPRFEPGVLPNEAGRTVFPVRVMLGDREVQAIYAGVTPFNAGLYQLSFTIREGLPPGKLSGDGNSPRPLRRNHFPRRRLHRGGVTGLEAWTEVHARVLALDWGKRGETQRPGQDRPQRARGKAPRRFACYGGSGLSPRWLQRPAVAIFRMQILIRLGLTGKRHVLGRPTSTGFPASGSRYSLALRFPQAAPRNQSSNWLSSNPCRRKATRPGASCSAADRAPAARPLVFDRPCTPPSCLPRGFASFLASVRSVHDCSLLADDHFRRLVFRLASRVGEWFPRPPPPLLDAAACSRRRHTK